MSQYNAIEDKPCPLGCPRSDELLFTGRDRLHNIPGDFDVVKCKSCGLMRTNPRPTPESIGNYYPDNYGPYLGTMVKDSNISESRLKSFFRPIIRQIFNFNMTNLPDIPKGSLLEIGCASGAFMNKMANEGWSVQGIEFSPDAAERARKLGHIVHAGPLETAPTPEKLFDLIIGWMVIEHLHEPLNGLKKLNEWAKPGAYLVISIPNAGSKSFNEFGNKWYDLHLPNHLYHFTPDSIGKVLISCGWKIEKIHHQRVMNNIIASLGYTLKDKGWERLSKYFIEFPNRSSITAYIFYPVAWFLSIWGQTGRMTIWAKRVD